MIIIKSQFVTGRTVCLVGLLLVATVLAEESGPADPSPRHKVATVTSNEDVTSSVAKSESQDSNDHGPMMNPFQYRMPHDPSGFVSSPHTSIPPGIKVLAIMVVQDRKPLAVLQIPGMVDVFYVRADDIIGVEAPPIVTRSKSPRTNQTLKTARKTIVYLKIEEITAQQVVLHPQENPAGKEILR